MKKYVMHKFGKDCYLLGTDEDGIKYFLESGSWDCDWYWGFGYVETYTNNRVPHLSKDIASHQHFDGLFLNQRKNGYDAFKEFFAETPLTNDEIWKLLELMRSYYTARAYSDMIHRGGTNYTGNPVVARIKNDIEYKRINEEVIPTIMEEVYNILGNE